MLQDSSLLRRAERRQESHTAQVPSGRQWAPHPSPVLAHASCWTPAEVPIFGEQYFLFFPYAALLPYINNTRGFYCDNAMDE
jgi:hypothetical protein